MAYTPSFQEQALQHIHRNFPREVCLIVLYDCGDRLRDPLAIKEAL